MSFFNFYSHNYVRVASAIPRVHLADPAANAKETIELLAQAQGANAMLAVFPELGLSGYSCEDLFHQRALVDASLEALRSVRDVTKHINIMAVVGLPLQLDGLLYNCCAVVARGRIWGITPKTYLPNYLEFYEMRHFTPGDYAPFATVNLLGEEGIPFGSRLLFSLAEQPQFKMHIEICEDLWTPIPPSSYASLAGATMLVNPSGSPVTIGKDAYRRQLVTNQSGRCIAAYLYSGAGFGESTTEVAWDGHGLICENGSVLAETERFAYQAQLVTADIDLDRIAQDRVRLTTFGQSMARERDRIDAFRTITVDLPLPGVARLDLQRTYERFPYVPSDPAQRETRCREVLDIQVQGLVRRLEAMNAKKVVIGVSGGLDSTQALLVCAATMDRMKLPRKNILAYTMPGYATSERTLKQSHQLMTAVGATTTEIDIRPSCLQMLKDIGHPYGVGKEVFDITFENVQAGERTSHLFRLANLHNAPVIGTGDLSETALGWCTYGVGDQMAHYNVNASVPKTLIQFLIRYVASSEQLGRDASAVLMAVLDTEISPELVPGKNGGQPAQSTEAVVGPYELQDFHLYYTLRYGYSPRKVAFLAWSAWHEESVGHWPDIPAAERRTYAIGEIKRWLGVFLCRFFQLSQYKRTAMPNAPKVGSGGSLSPRGDYRAPSDSDATTWLADHALIPDTGPGLRTSARKKSVAVKKSTRRNG
ncbi:MAG: NAD(+) synthase [Betaproteobacteria bacterium]|nr:NAD(+) synthase [Betaproteobacteria bacterium]